MRALIPPTDAARVASLARYRLLDTPAEALFDALARLASELCEAPVARIEVADDRRLWIKASIGPLESREAPLDASFCRYALEENVLFEIPDATADPRFAANPYVTGPDHVRFYAGYPLVTRDGVAIGTLCVIDRVPRKLDAMQRTTMAAISRALVEQFEARRDAFDESARAPEHVALLSTAVESSSDGIAIVACDGDAPLMMYANEAFVRQSGIEHARIAGSAFDLSFGGRFDPLEVGALYRHACGGEHARGALAAVRKDAGERWLDLSARPLAGASGGTSHVVLTVRDATESVLRELTLETQNERLTRLTSIARELFGALEPSALIDALRRGIYELTGGRAVLYAARPDGTFAVTSDLGLPTRDAEAGDEIVQRAAQSEMPTIEEHGARIAVRVIGSSGQAAYVLNLVSTNEDALSMADVFALQLISQYFAVAVRNVELYSELSARRASVTELNQIKNDLIAMLAHDFKGPLTTIVGFADILAENDALDEEARTFCRLIASSAMRLASLATDTLALSRLESNELALTLGDVDVLALVREIARTFSVTRTIDVRIDREAPIVVRADASRLRQVFENLIGNAIKYSPGGQPVEIAIRRIHDGAEISVRDHGIGIPATDREKLFGRFARAANARAMGISGTGFGLYLAKTIVDLHGGRISVESREGKGSTFRVLLPGSLASERSVIPRLLLLDRDGEARSYIAHTLRSAGYAVRVTVKARDTLEALRTEVFDVAIIDLDRLEVDVASFVERIPFDVREQTGFVWLGALADVRPTDRDAFLQKPFLVRDLQSAVDAAVGRGGDTVTAKSVRGA